MTHRFATVSLVHERVPPPEMVRRARAFREEIEKRRSVRHFAPDPVPMEAIDECIAAAGSAPSGANRQPWTFVVVTDPKVKRAIREAAEEEERLNYDERMSEEWLEALAPLGTNWEKPFLEIAPALIVVFRHTYGVSPGSRSELEVSGGDLERGRESGKHVKNYYTMESVGIAVGFLLAALHSAGFATLTHTPSPMGFLQKILGRPENEKAFVLIPVGYPIEGCVVPDIGRKALEEIRYTA